MGALGTGIARAALVTAVWVGSVQSANAGVILWHQVATSPGGAASQVSPNTDYLSADDFILETGARIHRVQWQGAFFGEPPSAITRFDLTFWSDRGGLPGVALQSYRFGGNAGQTFEAADSLGFMQYAYSVMLPTPFVAHRGVRTWLSIQPTTDFPAQPQWYWRQAEGAGKPYSANAGAGGSRVFQPLPLDLAFTLSGTKVNEPPPHRIPEPSTLLLFGSGFVALWRFRNRGQGL